MLAPGVKAPGPLRVHYELISCAVNGHYLVGTDAAELRAEDRLFVREQDGVRWHRCLRCDSWVILAPPARAGSRYPPTRDTIALPLRGRALRDKLVLRLIAVDRAVHCLILAVLAVAIIAFVSHEGQLRQDFYRITTDLQTTFGGGPVQNRPSGVIRGLDRLFSLRTGTLHLVVVAVAAYAVLEGVEAVGLWYQRRWAEYLTLVATAVFLPLEVHELISRFTWFRVIAFVINLAIVVYLLYAKRLFGLRGGARAERRERERDGGWKALERNEPSLG